MHKGSGPVSGKGQLFETLLRASTELAPEAVPTILPGGGIAPTAVSNRAFTVATSPSLPARVARRRVVPLVVPLLPYLRLGRAAIFRTLAELSLGYRTSPISVCGPDRARSAHGERVPNGPLTDAARHRTMFHELLRARAFHLFPAGTSEAWRDVAVPPGVVVHHLSIHGDRPGANQRSNAGTTRTCRPHRACIVRADGHVALRGETDLSAAWAYLRRWLPGGA